MNSVSHAITYYHNFTPVGDVLVLGVCLVIIVLMQVAYIVRSKTFRTFQLMIFVLMLAAASDMGYHILLNKMTEVNVIFTYITRNLYHFLLFFDLFLYVVYAVEPLRLGSKSAKKYIIT